MHDGSVLASAGDEKIAGKKYLRQIRIRKLDDATYMLSAEFEGIGKEGMRFWDNKEYSYKTVKELKEALITDFLKPNMAMRDNKAEKYLKTRED